MAGGSIGETFPLLLKDLGLLALGLAVYGAVFAFIGARVPRPLVAGLVLVFGWEQIALVVPGYLRRFTVAYYLQSLVPHAMPQDDTVAAIQSLFSEPPSAAVEHPLAVRHPGGRPLARGAGAGDRASTCWSSRDSGTWVPCAFVYLV